MRYIPTKTTVYLLLIIALVETTGCSKLCDEGYEGKHCVTEIRGKMLHNYYNVAGDVSRDSCNTANTSDNYTDTASIIEGVNVNEVRFTHVRLKNNYINLTGKVDADNQIIIPQQIVSSHTFLGSGFYQNGNVSLAYTAIRNCDTSVYVLQYTR